MSEDFLGEVLAEHTESGDLDKVQRVSGGCINETVKIQSGSNAYFLKWNVANERDMFEKEAAGLNILARQRTFKVPKVFGKGVKENKSYLLLDWIEGGMKSSGFWADFGKKLAKQHRVSSETFGLTHHNYIGRLPQSNHQHENWVDFFITERIEPQLRLASKSGLINTQLLSNFQSLFPKLDQLVPAEHPSLLHGDLWGGNFLCSRKNEPVLIDPAVHFGHRETELAFTTLFGGFDQTFYQTYRDEFPLEPGFEERIDIHNLYPLLVHVNLFGASYLSGIQQTLKKFA